MALEPCYYCDGDAIYNDTWRVLDKDFPGETHICRVCKGHGLVCEDCREIGPECICDRGNGVGVGIPDEYLNDLTAMEVIAQDTK
jgi:hypothetical protein